MAEQSRGEQHANRAREMLRQGRLKEAERELTRLERKLPLLATTGNVTPFIGLFGTVWGILRAFQKLAHPQRDQSKVPGTRTRQVTNSGSFRGRSTLGRGNLHKQNRKDW